MKGEGCGKSSEKAQETKLLTVTHTWCQSVPWESVPAPLCTPSIAGGGDWQKQTHPHLLQAPNLIHQRRRPSCGGTHSSSNKHRLKHGLAEAEEAKCFLLPSPCLLCPAQWLHFMSH